MDKYLPKIIGFFINLVSIFSSKYAAHIAIKLFSSPFKGKTKPHQAKYLNKAIQEPLTYKDLTIQTYHWQGHKDTVLLAHGWESNSYRWKDLISILKQANYNVVALDAPAHGSSSGKLFNAIIYSECIHAVAKKFKASVIIGHSVGAMATVFSQYNMPKKHLNKIVLLGAPSNFTGIFSRYSKLMGYNTAVKTAINQYIQKRFNHLPNYFSASNFSRNFTVKGLIIHDEKDKIIPFQDGLDYKKCYTNSKFISTSGLGHGLKSDTLYNHILEFLNK